jgi:iron complex outermembrane recepter protein
MHCTSRSLARVFTSSDRAAHTLRGFLVAGALLIAMANGANAADTGSISGVVNNTATGNLLEGARVAIPQLGLTVFTDNTGRYVVNNVPSGAHEIVVSYIGLDPARALVTVSPSRRTQRDFDLSTQIYTLDAFRVVGEREGDAAAITAQRNAENVKNMVSMDSFGNLPNMSAGEVVKRLPGVAGSPTEEGLNYRFNIRGMDPALNTVTIDGGLLPSLATTRAFELQSITGTMFDTLELVKGHTPDKGADSLGGTINLKSRSPLSIREKRRTTYNFNVRMAPPFLEHTPMREQHRAHPLLTLAHQEVFDVFGGERNLGVSLNLFYSENVVGGWSRTFDYQNTTDPDAFVWDYRTWDNFNNRKQRSLNFKTDYRWSPSTKLTLSLIGNDNSERHKRTYEIRAFTGAAGTVPNATTTGVVPGAYDSRVTVVRPVAAAIIDVANEGPLNYFVRMRRVDVGAEHEFGRLHVDYTGGISTTHLNNGHGTAGLLNMRLTGAGWVLDRTESNRHPQFTRNGGPDFTNPDNYRPAVAGLRNNQNEQDQQVRQLRFNARYEVPVTVPLFVKAGFSWREQRVERSAENFHRWNYIGSGPLASDPNFMTFDRVKTGRNIPLWQPHMFMDNARPRDPSLWREDLYFHESQKFIGTQGMTEKIPAAYAMAQGRLGRDGWRGRTGFLGGVRLEKTQTYSWGWVRARVPSTAAQQLADPAGTAARDYAGNYRELRGEYSDPFPSAHVFHDITANLKARMSYSTSFGRPAFTELLPNETIDENNNRLTRNNPSLKPQMATNWDASLEYYFEPVGALTVGWFHKRIKDYILRNQEIGVVPTGLDNGYNGEYEGWTERTSVNGGTAIAQGWEFSYQQQFTFLPGLLRGLAGSFNYTRIMTHGDRGGGSYLTTRQVQGFIPYSANASLSWRYRGFSTRLLYNFTGEYITNFNVNNPALSLYRFSHKTVDVSLAYKFRPALSFTVDVNNVFNEPQEWYRGTKDRSQRMIFNFVTISAGINGRF